MNKITISIIGLGYVGLPLAYEFAKKFNVIGYDTNTDKIQSLINKKKVQKLTFTSYLKDIKKSNIKIVCVPTPVNKKKEPDLSLLIKASRDVGKFLNEGDVVIYESTVYPGVTEEICLPILEKASSMKCAMNKNSSGFFIGYSPERINPGDNKRTISKITKIVSGNCKYSLNLISSVYSSIIKAGIHKASDIKTAEAAKIIENIQRDVNIALINEFSLLFNKMNIDTYRVLEAAETKWNFLKFYPGLVGGHCIGIDPYYLSFKAKSLNFSPIMIESGRKVNDQMAGNISKILIKKLKNNGPKNNKKILILGLSFKENCEDIRNSKVYDIYKFFMKNSFKVDVYDPLVDIKEAKEYYGINLLKILPLSKYACIIIAVKHNIFLKIGAKKINKMLSNKGIVLDIKNLFPRENYLRL